MVDTFLVLLLIAFLFLGTAWFQENNNDNRPRH